MGLGGLMARNVLYRSSPVQSKIGQMPSLVVRLCSTVQYPFLLSAVQVNTATLSAKDPQFVQKARTVGKRQALIVNNFVLEGDTKPSTLVLKRVEVWRPNAKVVTMTPRGPVTRGPPDTRMFRGTVAGSPGSSVVLTVRENGGVSGLALRGKSSWSLGKRGQGGSPTTAPLGSRKSRPGEQANLPKFTVDDVRHKPKSGASRAATPATGAFTAGTAGGLLQVCNAKQIWDAWVNLLTA